MGVSPEKRKELQEQYKLMKPDMGIVTVINKKENKYFLEIAPNLKSMINRVTFQLKFDGHPHQELQSDWNKLGADNFEIKILDTMPYEDDESKTDYKEDLELLKIIWTEKLTKDEIPLY